MCSTTTITPWGEKVGKIYSTWNLGKDSIPSERVERVLQTINAGVRIQGVIIADDERRTAPPAKPPRPRISLYDPKLIIG